ncbi:MAG: bifunctional YncE family protein/alkaline phosphatase family protein [Verrucomicrobia bacterium]|nr:bifunctional YncE family protein/alkaline phosphatase family protein [Verrucomicrobiota bacterium]
MIALNTQGQSNTRKANEDVNSADLRQRPGLKPDENLLFNGWGVSPAGKHVLLGDMPLKMMISPDQKMLVAVSAGFINVGLTLIDLEGKRVAQFVPLPVAWNGLAFSKDGKRIFVSGGDSGSIHAFKYADGKATTNMTVKPSPDAVGTFLGSIAVHPSTGKLYVCNQGNHEIWVVNPDTLALEMTIPVGQYPHSCAMGADKRYLYVSNWGSRSLSIIDTEKNRRERDITVGLRPNDMTLAPDGRLFVACAGDNTVHVIMTKALENPGLPASPARPLWAGTREIISTSLYPQSPEGSTPSAVAVSPDGKTLFIANSDNNNVMVVNITDEKTSVADGFIPVGWYPSALAVSPDNRTLLVANGKGLKSRANVPARTKEPDRLHKPPAFDYIGDTFEGSISFIAKPGSAQMATYTEQVRRNSPYTPEALHRAPMRSHSVIPTQVGEPCPIKYVLYIIKENRTYDQVFGDFKDSDGKPAGNGDPKLTMYGENVTPNHHQLARDYVLLDNFYCNGEVSVDGHSWCDAAIATDYNQRSWILSYSKHGRMHGNEEMENPAAGYLWDLCRRHGVSFKNYGEGAQRVPSINRGTWGPGRDKDRVDWWIKDLQAAEKSGDLPRFMIMSLGENHTRGTRPGEFTPDACVASNDIGLGKIVEAATRSKFWKEMAIFVTEDDAQNGPDHVDAHRTVGLVISPYCKRHIVDSTLYTTASMIRTMELILGLPPLTQYDAGATPMFNCFRPAPIATPYTMLTPKVDLYAKNTAKSPFAKESSRMNFSEYDLAPEDELNRILWYVAKGPHVPYPAPVHRALFTQP